MAPSALEAMVQAELINHASEMTLIVTDAISQMGLICPSFVEEVVSQLPDGGVPVIATVALHGEATV